MRKVLVDFREMNTERCHEETIEFTTVEDLIEKIDQVLGDPKVFDQGRSNNFEIIVHSRKVLTPQEADDLEDENIEVFDYHN